MSYYSDNMEKLKGLPDRYVLLFVTAKVLGGIGIGVLLAKWLPAWTWWILIIVACITAIPVAQRIFRK